MGQCFPKRRDIKFRNRGITKNKEYKNPAFIGMYINIAKLSEKYVSARSSNVLHRTSAKVEVVI
jgi:hypothetical protein